MKFSIEGPYTKYGCRYIKYLLHESQTELLSHVPKIIMQKLVSNEL